MDEDQVTDFSECKYISDQMRYFTFEDFYKIKGIIKERYQRLSIDAKQFYKWYVYANIHTNMQQKNRIWEYLNGYIKANELRKITNPKNKKCKF